MGQLSLEPMVGEIATQYWHGGLSWFRKLEQCSINNVLERNRTLYYLRSQVYRLKQSMAVRALVPSVSYVTTFVQNRRSMCNLIYKQNLTTLTSLTNHKMSLTRESRWNATKFVQFTNLTEVCELVLTKMFHIPSLLALQALINTFLPHEEPRASCILRIVQQLNHSVGSSFSIQCLPNQR